MKLEQVYNFFIHPFSDNHSTSTKIFSSLTILACGILLSPVFFTLVKLFHLEGRPIAVKNEENKMTRLRETHLDKEKPNPDRTKIELIKEKHTEQFKKFEEWVNRGDWKMFSPEYSHYDWWMFPITRPSQHGTTYSLSKEEIETLKKDSGFMQQYRKGVEWVVLSWGWDLHAKCRVKNATPKQAWTGYGVRLGKMADSLYLFCEKDLYTKLQEFFKEVCLTQIERYPIDSWVSNNLSR